MKQQDKQPNTKLKRERELRGWSQQKIAGAIGTSDQVVNRWENGQHRPNRHFQTQLCELFDKSAVELGFMNMPESIQEKIETRNEQSLLSSLIQDNGQREIVPLLSEAMPKDIMSLANEQGGIDLNKLRRLLLKETLGLTTGVALFERARLAVNQHAFVTANEDLIAEADVTIRDCWQLHYIGKSFLVELLLPTFLTQLVSLVQEASKYQKQLASITSQAYQLSCELSTNQENYGNALALGREALKYAKIAGSTDLQVAVLMRLANLYFHRKQSTYALRAYQEALPLLDTTSPLLRGRIYAGLAEVYAMRNQKQNALSCIGLAHEHYPDKPEQDAAYYYTHITRYSLYVFGEGQTRLYLKQPEEAVKQFEYVEKNLLATETETLSSVDLFYYQAEASLMLGDLEKSCAYIQVAVESAKNENSRLYYNKVLATYQEMRKTWQHESLVNNLEALFQPW